MNDSRKLEEIADLMAPKPDYCTVRVRTEVRERLEEWKEVLGQKSLTDTLSVLESLARKELERRVVERREGI